MMAFSMDSMEAARAALALTEVSGPSLVASKGLPMPPGFSSKDDMHLPHTSGIPLVGGVGIGRGGGLPLSGGGKEAMPGLSGLSNFGMAKEGMHVPGLPPALGSGKEGGNISYAGMQFFGGLPTSLASNKDSMPLHSMHITGMIPTSHGSKDVHHHHHHHHPQSAEMNSHGAMLPGVVTSSQGDAKEVVHHHAHDAKQEAAMQLSSAEVTSSSTKADALQQHAAINKGQMTEANNMDIGKNMPPPGVNWGMQATNHTPPPNSVNRGRGRPRKDESTQSVFPGRMVCYCGGRPLNPTNDKMLSNDHNAHSGQFQLSDQSQQPMIGTESESHAKSSIASNSSSSASGQLMVAPSRCDVCGKLFKTKGLLTQHMLVHNNIRKHVCVFCDKAFKQQGHLETHTRTHTGDRPFKCSMPDCDRKFTQLANLQNHLRNHDNPRKRGRRRGDGMAAAHAAALTLATGLQPVTHAQWIQGMGIRLENGEFQSIKDVKVMDGPLQQPPQQQQQHGHQQQQQPKMMAFRGKGRPRNEDNKIESQCYSSLPGICGETVTLQLLGSPDGDPSKKQQQHLGMKENESNNAPSAGGGLDQQSCNHHVNPADMAADVVTPSPSDSLHSVGKQQMVAGMSDMSPIPSESGHVHVHGDHSKHMVPMHPVACPECSKMFTNKGLLTQHMLVHTNKRKHVCSFCEKAFKQQAHLDTHLRIHTGVRPFKCSMPNCERTFTQLANLQYHIRNHDSQLRRAAASMRERVRCPICFKAYDSTPALERHMYEFHKIYDRPRN